MAVVLGLLVFQFPLTAWSTPDTETVGMEAHAEVNRLEGSWLWVWGQLVEPPETGGTTVDAWVASLPTESVTVPKLWHQLSDRANQGQGIGHATYILPIAIKSDADEVWTLASSVLNTSGRYRLYDDSGRALTSWMNHGQVGEGASSSIPLYRRSTLSFAPPANGRVWLVMQVAAYHHPRGGIGHAPKLGPAGEIQRDLLFQFGRSLFTLAVLFIIAVYHAVIFFLRKSDRAPLLFSLLCSTVFIRELVLSYVLEYFFSDGSVFLFNTRLRAEYLTMSLGVVTCVLFIHSLLPFTRLRGILLRGLVGAGALLSVCALLMPPTTFTEYVALYQILILVMFLLSLIHLTAESIRRQPNALGILVGAVVFVSGVGHDILSNMKVLSTPFIAPYTFIAFILVQSWVVARSYTRAMEERDATQKTLLETYQKLDAELLKRETLVAANEVLKAEMDSASQQLIQADKMATLGTLVAGVAHDIANPTHLILSSQVELIDSQKHLRSMVRELLSGEDSDEAKEVLAGFEGGFENSHDHVDRIGLGAARIDEIHRAIRNQARRESHPVPCRLRELVDECRVITNAKLKYYDVEADVADVGLIAIRSQLSQVFTNIISNAADALSECGSLSDENLNLGLRISTEVLDDGGLTLSFEDSGGGVPPEIAERIWEPFFTTKDVEAGTGLGMPIVKRIIDQHGFDITLDRSEKMGGARFTIVFPSASVML